VTPGTPRDAPIKTRDRIRRRFTRRSFFGNRSAIKLNLRDCLRVMTPLHPLIVCFPHPLTTRPSFPTIPTTLPQIFKAALDILPGGVNSPVRAFKSVGGGPIVFDRVKDAYAWDVDGNKYVDYVGSWGPAICGHANDRVNAKLKEQIDKGTSFGAPCELENVLGQMVIDRVPSVEMVRFCNSGTEACLSVLRVMRAHTGRTKIIKFEGCYHGHADPFLVQAGSGVATLGLPDSPGVPDGATNTTLCAPYNDLEAVKRIFAENKGEIAGVILEPVVGNSGFIVPDKSFLEGLREITTAEGALLTFDEVMTGFRISKGCAQEYWGVTPDLTTMGKVIGGGLPVGAYGGRREIMEIVAPAGPMYQAGTLSGNPLAMVAGIETLNILAEDGKGLSQSPHSASLIAHTRLTLSFFTTRRVRVHGGNHFAFNRGNFAGGQGQRPRRVRRLHPRHVRPVFLRRPRAQLRGRHRIRHRQVRQVAPRHA
jgi:glutamate-1-semialdehyde-2,1-aminomutase